MANADHAAPDTCGACIAFLPEGEGEHGPVGRCRLRPERGVIAHSLPYCPKYVERGTGRTHKPPKRPAHGRARGWYDDTEVVVEPSRLPDQRSATPETGPRRAAGRPPGRLAAAKVERRPSYGSSIDLGDGDMDTRALRALLEDILTEHGVIDDSPMADKWVGGTLVMKPADGSLQPKEVPIEAFFHKIVMIRDRLRVMEQKINASEGLSDKEKIDLQGYVTRVYGSLTTFNVLFRDREDQFVGAKS
jgi:hypothetical protein